ncbi:MAG: CorA family divalent cation transporter [Actinomycetota bacterium]
MRLADRDFVWLKLHEPTPEETGTLPDSFGLSKAVLSEATGDHSRPLILSLDAWTILVLKPARRIAAEEIAWCELVLLLGDGILISIGRGGWDPLERASEWSDEPDDAAPALISVLRLIVDGYREAIVSLDEDVCGLEDMVFSPTRLYRVERLYAVMHEVLRFHRATTSMVDVLDSLPDAVRSSADGDRLEKLREDLSRMVVRSGALKGSFTSLLQAHEIRAAVRQAQVNTRHAEISTRQNEDMRKISAWAAIIAVPTLVTGLYGMNFTHMPELDWEFGYPIAVGVLILVSVSLYRYFRHIKWL